MSHIGRSAIYIGPIKRSQCSNPDEMFSRKVFEIVDEESEDFSPLTLLLLEGGLWVVDHEMFLLPQLYNGWEYSDVWYKGPSHLRVNIHRDVGDFVSVSSITILNNGEVICPW